MDTQTAQMLKPGQRVMYHDIPAKVRFVRRNGVTVEYWINVAGSEVLKVERVASCYLNEIESAPVADTQPPADMGTTQEQTQMATIAPTIPEIARDFKLFRKYFDTDMVWSHTEFDAMSEDAVIAVMADGLNLKRYAISNTQSGAPLGVYWGQNASDALEEMARDAGYPSFSDLPTAPHAGEIVAVEVPRNE